MNFLIMAIATGLYSGYLPKAPGTWGSLLGLIIFLPLSRLVLPAYLAVVAGLFVVGFLCAGSAEKFLDRKDPGVVVIDEIVGLLIALAGAPASPLLLGLGFALFRFFDILKPFPIRWVDQRVNGGLGIMLDDVVAGLYSLAILQIFRLFWGG